MRMAVAPTDRSSSERFSVTPRVLARLADNARFGVVTSDQHARRDGGSRQVVTRLLGRCVEHSLLKRLGPSHSTLLTGFFDTRPACFTIAPRGLRVLAAAGIPIDATPKRNTTILAHDVEVTETMFAFAAAAARAGAVLIDQPELFSTFPPETRALSKPLRLQVEATPRDFPHLSAILTEPTPIGIEPDRLIAIARAADNLGYCLALELDRATEDLHARRLKGKATYLRKVLGYTAAWRSGKHLAQFGACAKAFRVAVITTSDARIGNMIAIEQRLAAPAGLFVHTTPQRLAEYGPLGPAWRDGKGQTISLINVRE
jgi:hypothetical protein